MEPRKVPKQKPKTQEVRKNEPGTRFRLVKLEDRIAPKLAVNHCETVVREPVRSKPKVSQAPKARGRLRVVKLEERIAPKLATNHNETLVRETAGAKPKAPEPRITKGRLRIVKLEERVAPKIATNHNEAVVRDRRVNVR
jgi:hypothetical protein